MKTIVRNDNNVALYLFEDDVSIVQENDKTLVGNPTQFIIGDCDNQNTRIVENVQHPDPINNDWFGYKYLHDGEWKLNPDFIDPRKPQ